MSSEAGRVGVVLCCKVTLRMLWAACGCKSVQKRCSVGALCQRPSEIPVQVYWVPRVSIMDIS